MEPQVIFQGSRRKALIVLPVSMVFAAMAAQADLLRARRMGGLCRC